MMGEKTPKSSGAFVHTCLLLLLTNLLAGCASYSDRHIVYAPDDIVKTPVLEQPAYDDKSYAYNDPAPVQVNYFHELVFDSAEIPAEQPTDHLRAISGKTLTVQYDITNRLDEKSGTFATSTSDMLRASLNDTQNHQFKVRFRCSICGPQIVESGAIPLKRRASGAFEKVAYAFTPMAGSVKDPANPRLPGGITATVWDNGQRSDEVYLCIELDKDGNVCPRTTGIQLLQGANEKADLSSTIRMGAGEAYGRQDAMVAEGINAVSSMERHQDSASFAVKVQHLKQPLFVKPDVEIDVHPDFAHPTQNLVVDISIYDPKVARELASSLDASDQPGLAQRIKTADISQLSFQSKTAFSDFTALSDSLERTYRRLSCMATGDRTFLRTLASNEPVNCSAKTASVLQTCNDANSTDCRRAQDLMQLAGERLYNDLFAPDSGQITDADLIMRALFLLSKSRMNVGVSHPLSIRVQAGDGRGSAHIPLQLAHIPNSGLLGKSQADDFFGLVFAIAADKTTGVNLQPLDRSDPKVLSALQTRERAFPWTDQFVTVVGLFTDGRLLPPPETTAQIGATRTYMSCDQWMDGKAFPQPGESAVASNGTSDASVKITACKHYMAISGKLRDAAGEQGFPAVTGDAFLYGDAEEDVKGILPNMNASLIWFYGHGDSHDPATGRIKETELIFKDTDKERDVISQSKIADIASESSTSVALTSGPLVVLLACESGVSRGDILASRSLTDTFIGLGARGVVATESQIDSVSADHFGKVLLSALFDEPSREGGPASAVLMARRSLYYGETRDLWPLLVYYAGAAGPYIEN